MISIDISNLIPESLKKQAIDTLVDFLADQSKKYASDEIVSIIKKLRSDAAFIQEFEAGLGRAVQRFIDEYESEDEDLVTVIAADEDFFRNDEVQSALLAILKKPNAFLTDEKGVLALAFSSVLPNRKSRQRVDRAVTYLLKCLAQEIWHLPELQGIYSLQFQRITAKSALEQVALQRAQLQVLTGLDVSIREALLKLTTAIAQQNLLPSGFNSNLPNIRQNLPQPHYERFVGRKEELETIRRLLSPHNRYPVVTIDGIGGIGKSALALEAATLYLRDYNNLPEEERFDAIIWTTAKQTVLTGEGINDRPQPLRNIEDIYTTIAITLEREDITRAPKDKQADLICHTLTHQRTLLIMDNLETVDDERVMTFIREVPSPTKVLVTTRHRIDVAYPMRIVEMAQREALELIADEAQRKGVVLTADEAQRLFRHTGGIPLAIVWSIAQMGFGYSAEVVLTRLGQPISDIARFCFDTDMEYIRGRPAYKLLMSLSLFATSATREALGYMADLSLLDRDEGLAELEKLSLVNRDSNRFNVLQLTKTYISSELQKNAPLSSLLISRSDAWFRKLCEQPYDFVEDVDTETFLNERLNIKEALNRCLRSGKDDLAIRLALLFSRDSYHAGFIDESIEAAQTGLELARQQSEHAFVISFLDILGLICAWHDDYTKAIDYLIEAKKLSRSIGNVNLFDVLDHLGSQFMRQGQHAEAKKFLSKAHEVAIESQNPLWIARSLYLFGVLCYRMRNLIGARVYLEQALQACEEYESKRLYSWIKNYMGFVALDEGNYAEAKQHLDASLDTAIRLNDKRRVARIKEAQGILELKLGNDAESFRLLQESLQRFQHLGMHRDVDKIQALLRQLAADRLITGSKD